ncbi:MAG: heparinase II/III family protein [Rhodospirillales bacterium]|nr:heparinase II/III family protein [Rhodospirillales bacterium]
MTSGAFLNTLRDRASRAAYGSFLYNWTLKGAVAPRLLLKPADPWPGNADRGRFLCTEVFSPSALTGMSVQELHAFEWLRDVRAVGREAARRHARTLVESWIERYNAWDERAWEPETTGRRIAAWIALYDFFGDSADEEFQRDFFDSLHRQARHLSRTTPGMLHGVGVLHAVRGLLFAGLALEGCESWAEQAVTLLARHLNRQSLADGGVESRSPTDLCGALRCLIDIRGALTAAGQPVPAALHGRIEAAGQALRFFRHGDRGLALFNGAQEGDAALLDALVTQSGASGRILRTLPRMGYERVMSGKGILIVDVGGSPAWPEDGAAHAAPLAFEFGYGRDRVFVSCGSAPARQDWRDMLRGTAAHTALSVDCRNACEIRADGHLGRRPGSVVASRTGQDDAALVEASHDGYVPVNGMVHRRRLYLGNRGQDLRGEDALEATIGLSRSAEVTARFHLHPSVAASLTSSGADVLLRLPGGSGWRFQQSGARLSLETSVYVGDGATLRKTRQIVLSAPMESDRLCLKWALRKEDS